MQAIANALVYAVTYINLRAADGDGDDDVAALESIAGMLNAATEEEKEALASAAERALANERDYVAREEFVRDYSTWMEDMFGDGWVGNKRA